MYTLGLGFSGSGTGSLVHMFDSSMLQFHSVEAECEMWTCLELPMRSMELEENALFSLCAGFSIHLERWK